MKLSNANLLPPMEQVSDSSSSSFVSSSDSSQDLASRIQEVVCNALPLAPHFGYKKVIVTGGAGFIGSHVDGILLARGDDVVDFDEMNDYYDVRIKQTNYPDEKRLKIDTRIACYVFWSQRLNSSSFINIRLEHIHLYGNPSQS
jgi:FlaA1/EpsC-like NDP-sugar epimerase